MTAWCHQRRRDERWGQRDLHRRRGRDGVDRPRAGEADQGNKVLVRVSCKASSLDSLCGGTLVLKTAQCVGSAKARGVSPTNGAARPCPASASSRLQGGETRKVRIPLCAAGLLWWPSWLLQAFGRIDDPDLAASEATVSAVQADRTEPGWPTLSRNPAESEKDLPGGGGWELGRGDTCSPARSRDTLGRRASSRAGRSTSTSALRGRSDTGSRSTVWAGTAAMAAASMRACRPRPHDRQGRHRAPPPPAERERTSRPAGRSRTL